MLLTPPCYIFRVSSKKAAADQMSGGDWGMGWNYDTGNQSTRPFWINLPTKIHESSFLSNAPPVILFPCHRSKEFLLTPELSFLTPCCSLYCTGTLLQCGLTKGVGLILTLVGTQVLQGSTPESWWFFCICNHNFTSCRADQTSKQS